MKEWLLAGSGGFIGSALRYVLSGWLRSLSPAASFPWGTFSVNVLGCLVMGCILGWTARENDWKIFLASGVCGGFTTFSAFAAENHSLLSAGKPGLAALYIASSLVLGLTAFASGWYIIRALN